jgi:two-component system, cell cycle sensor histidine kinase and response regulator CckA
VREYTTTVLERKGFRVVAVRNAAEALAWLEAGDEPIDALVTDIVMPGLSGPELARQIADRGQPLGLVLVSGYAEETLDLADMLARGAIFVAKPFPPLDLARAVNAALATPLTVTS